MEWKISCRICPSLNFVAYRISSVSVHNESSFDPQVVSYNRSKGRPRESSAQAVIIEMDAVRPDPTAPLEEYRCVYGHISTPRMFRGLR